MAYRAELPRIYRAMAENGSPAPRFDFEETRTWFRVTLLPLPREIGDAVPFGLHRIFAYMAPS